MIDVDLIIFKQPKKLSLKDKERETKINIYNFFSINEINICNKIKNIPYFINNFNIIISNNFIKIGEMSENAIDITNTQNNKYILCKYSYEKCIHFNDFFYNLPNIKLFVFHTFDSYTYLLDALIKLEDKNICFLNLSTENICFSENFKPILQNFGKSIILSKSVNDEYISKIIEEIDDFTYKPLEIYLLFYIIKNNENTVSYSLIEIIYEKYIKHAENANILTFFSENYKNDCINVLKKYINKPKTIIIHDIFKYYETWGNYGLSILYINIFNSILNNFSLNKSLISKIIIMLSKNIHPNPLKRETLEDTLNNYNKLFNDNKDWIIN